MRSVSRSVKKTSIRSSVARLSQKGRLHRVMISTFTVGKKEFGRSKSWASIPTQSRRNLGRTVRRVLSRRHIPTMLLHGDETETCHSICHREWQTLSNGHTLTIVCTEWKASITYSMHFPTVHSRRSAAGRKGGRSAKCKSSRGLSVDVNVSRRARS